MKRPTPVKGLKLNPKTGKLERSGRRLDTSAKIRQRKSKAVRATKRIKGNYNRP